MCILNIIEINILYNILYFIVIVITIGYILYKQNIIYISMILIIVYSTALVILFGFVIMKNKSNYPLSLSLSTSSILFPIVLIVLYYTLNIEETVYSSISTTIYCADTDIIYNIGNILYNDPLYIIIVLLSALILLFPILALVYL